MDFCVAAILWVCRLHFIQTAAPHHIKLQWSTRILSNDTMNVFGSVLDTITIENSRKRTHGSTINAHTLICCWPANVNRIIRCVCTGRERRSRVWVISMNQNSITNRLFLNAVEAVTVTTFNSIWEENKWTRELHLTTLNFDEKRREKKVKLTIHKKCQTLMNLLPMSLQVSSEV